jgi:hypothetical protein
MARQTAQKFLELLATNRSLQTHQQLIGARSISALTRFAVSRGFIFSEADLKVAMESVKQQHQASKS